MAGRIKWIDISKGILIVLVVLGHAHISTIVDLIINSFHMAAFFALTGYTFHFGNTFRVFIKKQIKGLLIPYIAFSLILLLYDAFKAYILHISGFDFLSGLLSIIVPISGRPSTTVYGLWFLPCLFIAKAVMYIGMKKWYTFFITIPVCGLIHIISGVISVISLVPLTIVFIAAGFFFRKVEERINRKAVAAISILLLFVASVFVNYILYPSGRDYSSLNLGNIPIYILGGIAGSYLVFTLSKVLVKVKPLESIGKNSLYYYGLHYEVLSGFVFLGTKLFGGIITSVLSALGTLFVLWIINNIRQKVCAFIWRNKNES